MRDNYITSILSKLGISDIAVNLATLEMLLEITAIPVIAAIVSIVISKILSKISSKAQNSNNKLILIVISSLEAPIHALIWISALYHSIKILPSNLSDPLIGDINNWDDYLIEGFIGWFLIRIIDGIYEYLKNHPLTKSGQIDQSFLSTVTKILKLIVFITISIMALDSLGVRVTGLLTFAGIGTAAIGFASKDLFSNYLGTLVIFFDKPFHVGDNISLPEKQIEGTVEEINWRMTKIRTYEHRILYVPNNYFYNICIKNNSRANFSKIKFNINIDPKDLSKITQIIAQIRTMILDHPSISTKYDNNVICLDTLSGYSPTILVECCAKTTDYLELKTLQSDLLMKSNEIVKANKASLYFIQHGF